MFWALLHAEDRLKRSHSLWDIPELEDILCFQFQSILNLPFYFVNICRF